MKQPIPFGNYYLMDLVAKGGMAEVFKAKYLGPEGFSKIVAVKRILPELAEEQEFVQMFIDEAKIASQLSHANVTQILQLGEAQGTYFIAMEYVQGKDLRTIYERSRRDDGHPVSPQMAAYIMAMVCDGLDYAHRRHNQQGKHIGIIHRDISPQNVIISYDGDVKLIDFGIAKAQDKLVKTEAGILKGKYCYMSPEQVRGGAIDHRSDIFGLGVVLFEILTRQRLFLGSNDLKTLENVLKKGIHPPSTINPAVPPVLDQICMRALSRDLNYRYHYASDMREELMQFLYTNPPTFSRRELASYMYNVFANDLDKEMKKQAAYEPFFEALPNTPLPSAVDQLEFSQTQSGGQPPQSGGHQVPQATPPGAYVGHHQNIGQSHEDLETTRGDVTSYSGPHPHPQQPPAMATHNAPHYAKQGAQHNAQAFHQQHQGEQRTASLAPPSQQGGYGHTPQPMHGHSYPPSMASQPPSYMYSKVEDEVEEDEDPTMMQDGFRPNLPPAPPSAPAPVPAPSGQFIEVAPTVGLSDYDDLPTRQVASIATKAIDAQSLERPPGHQLLQPPQEDLLRPSAPTVTATSLLENRPQPHVPRPAFFQPAPAAHPQKNAPGDFEDYDAEINENAETGMQATIQSDVVAPTKKRSSARSLVIALTVLCAVLLVGLAGMYTMRCRLFPHICKPAVVPVAKGSYTLFFADSAANTQVTLNNKPLEASKLERPSPNKIKLIFEKAGEYQIQIHRPGCRPVSNKIRIVLHMDMETPKIRLPCERTGAAPLQRLAPQKKPPRNQPKQSYRRR